MLHYLFFRQTIKHREIPSWAWWPMPIILAPRRLKQEDFKFSVSPDWLVTQKEGMPRMVWITRIDSRIHTVSSVTAAVDFIF